MEKQRPQFKLLQVTQDKSPIGRRSQADKGQKIFFLKSQKSVKLVSLAIGLALTALGALSISQIPQLNTNYSLEQFFPDKHYLVTESKKIRKTFYLQDRPEFLVVLKLPDGQKGHWLEPSTLARLKQISEHFQYHSDIKNVISLSRVEGVFETQDTLTVGSIFENLPEAKWLDYVKQQPVIQSQIISEDLRSTLLVLEPIDPNPQHLYQLGQNIKAEILNLFPELDVQIGGVPAIQARFSHRLYEELKLYLILTLVCFCAVFYFLLKGKTPLMLVLSSLVIVNIIVLGGLAFFGVPFSILLTTLPVIVSIVVVSLAVHCLHRWAEKLQELEAEDKSANYFERFKTSISVLRELALPNFLGSLTTAIGFLMLVTSVVPLIRQYAWTIAVSVMVAFVLTQLLLFGFMHFTSPILRQWTQRKSTWTLWFLKWSRPAFMIVLICTLGFVYAGKNISFSGRLFDDLPESEPARIITENIDKNFGGVVGYDLVLRAPSDGHFRTFSSLEAIDTLVKHVKALPHVGSAISYADLMGEKLPTSDAQVAELMFMYSMSAENPMRHYVTDSGKSARVAIRFHDIPGDEQQLIRDKIVAFAQSSFPNVKVIESGLSVRTHTINEEVSRALIFGFWESLFLIGCLIVVIFKSLRWALLSCLPNLIPPAILLGAMALAQTPIKPGVAIIFSIALGLAFNNTVYLLSRLRKIKDEKNLTHLPLRQALLQEGNPCLFETLVMFFGFMIFLTSDFQVNQTFGIYMLLSIFAGFVGDLVFLPATLKLFPSLLKSKAKINSSSVDEAAPSDSTDTSKSATESVAAGLALLLTSLLAFSVNTESAEAKANPAAEAVLKRVRAKLDAKDDQAKVKMIIIEANGEKKEREMELSTLKDDKFYALVRIQSPADVKGTALLAEIDKDEETHWLYVPSTKKVRRVVGANKNSGVLGSELMMEDLNSTAIKSSSVDIKSKDKKFIVLQVTPKKGTSLYSRVLSTISAKEFVPIKTYYYKGKRLAKTVAFSGYQKVKGDIWRARSIEVKNLENKRGTILHLSDLRVNSGLEKDEFSQNALKLD